MIIVRCLILMMLLTGCGGSDSSASATRGETVEFLLENGLRVVLLPDPALPKVATELRYQVGSAREPPGRSGFSHLFEHLMFTGTKAAPDFDAPLAAAGASANAFTTEDGARYQIEGPSGALGLMLALEADRMANLGAALMQEDLDRQRAVVLNELRQNVVDSPGFGAQEALASALYPPGHPYERPVIGTMADIEAATLEDAKAFFDLYYHPGNAFLAVAGDFDPAEARRLVEEAFGRVASAGPPTPIETPAPFPPRRARLELSDALPAPVVMAEWTGPAFGRPEGDALRVAAEALANPDKGLLRLRIAEHGAEAATVSAAWTPLRFGGRFAVVATAAEGVPVEALEQALRAALEAIRAEGLPAADISAAARRMRLEGLETQERLMERARRAVDALLTEGSAVNWSAGPERVGRLDPAAVNASARLWLDPEEASWAIVRPGGRGDPPEALTRSTGASPRFEPNPRVAAEIALPAPRPAQAPAFPQARRTMFANGLELLYYRRPGAPLAYAAAAAPGGEAVDPPGREGLAAMVGDMIGRSPDSVADQERLGLGIGGMANGLGTAALLTSPPESLEEGLRVFARGVIDPSYDEAVWRRLLENRTLGAAYNREFGPTAASEAVKSVFYALSSRDSRSESAESLALLTREAGLEAHRRMFRPFGARVILVADLPDETAERWTRAAFGAWAGEALARPRPSLPGPRDGRSLLIADLPGAAQTALSARIGGPGLLDSSAASEAAARALGSGITSRFNRILREQKAYTYSASAQLLNREDFGVLWIESSFGAETAAEAFTETLAILASLESAPIAAEELEAARAGRFSEDLAVLETARGLFTAALWETLDGRGLEARAARSQAMAALTLSETQEAGRRIAAAARAGSYALAGEAGPLWSRLSAKGLAAGVIGPACDADKPTPSGVTPAAWRAACAVGLERKTALR